MINDEVFNEGNLGLVAWQYQIRHEDTVMFAVGELVFLKSNPEMPLTVKEVCSNDVVVCWLHEGVEQSCEFPPECILQYRFAALKVYKQKFAVCFN